jgi:hypothetical protein
MTFATPLGLLALASIPAIIAIHLFRRRFPPRTVAGLFLWQVGHHMPEGGGRIDKLPITFSLLLECLAALALSLILAGARLSTAAEARHLVVLLDDSASMAARNARGESARDRGVRRVLAEIDRLAATGRVSLVLSGERPAVIAGPSVLPAAARGALERWQPRASSHPLEMGLRLARELAGKTGQLMIVTDAMPEADGASDAAGAQWVAVGEGVPNVGIIAAERALSPAEGRGAALLTLGNYSDVAQTRRVRIRAGEKDVASSQVSVPPGVSTLKLPLAAGLPTVHVVLDDDALARDNEVVLVEPHPAIVAVENRLHEGRGHDALERAIGALSNVTRGNPGELQFVPAEAIDAAPAPGVWRIAFGRPPAQLVEPGSEQDFVGPFVIEKRHPLLSGVTLAGVVWTGAFPVSLSAGHPLVSADTRPVISDFGGMWGPPSGGPYSNTLLVNLDLERTNLLRAPDWPILVSNLVELRRQNLPGPERWNYRVGETVRVRLGRDPKAALRMRLGATERTLPEGRAVELVAPAAGGLLEILEGQERLFEIGVNFLDERESDLRTRSSGARGAFVAAEAVSRGESGPWSDPIFWILLVTAGAAMFVNWCVPQVERRIA